MIVMKHKGKYGAGTIGLRAQIGSRPEISRGIHNEYAEDQNGDVPILRYELK